MKNADPEASEKVFELKRVFDQSFASPLLGHRNEYRDLIAFKSGESRFAIPISDLSGLEKNHKIVSVPDQNPYCLGVAGVRGVIIPVFSLPKILWDGDIHAQKEDAIEWLAICGGEDPVGLAFGGLEGHRRISVSLLRAPALEEEGTRYGRETFQDAESSGLVLDVQKILKRVKTAVL